MIFDAADFPANGDPDAVVTGRILRVRMGVVRRVRIVECTNSGRIGLICRVSGLWQPFQAN